MMSSQVVPQGYKQTKVGVIPEDWKVLKLNEKSSIQRGKFSPRPRNDPQYYNGQYPFVQTNEVVSSKGKISKYTQTLNDKGLKVSRLFPKGTILMTIAANIGFTGIIEQDMACPDSLVGIQCKKDLWNEYINFYFIYIQKRIDYLAEEAAQKNINLGTLNTLKIPLPPLKEQQKIANILITWDDAISEQNELIKAKEKLKKGLIQKLLSGEVRFGGFFNEWEEVALQKVLIERKEYSEKGLELEHVSLTKEGVVPKSERYERDFLVRDENKKYKTTYLHDICYNPANLKFGVICKNTFGSGIFSPIYVTFEVAKNNDVNYLDYLLTANDFIKRVRKYEQGTVYERMAVSPKDFLSFKLKLPSLQEQQKIAEVLSNVDKEIDLLKNELEVLKKQKKGLMQKLLTGEVRVNI